MNTILSATHRYASQWLGQGTPATFIPELTWCRKKLHHLDIALFWLCDATIATHLCTSAYYK